MRYNEMKKQISVYEFETTELYKKLDDLNLKRLKLVAKVRKIDYPMEKSLPYQWAIDDLEGKKT